MKYFGGSLKGWKFYILMFQGDDAFGWAVKLEFYFILCVIAFVGKMEALVGDAFGWCSGGNIATEISRWEDFKLALEVRFYYVSE